MSAPPYMKLYVADYLADTTHLTTCEHGAYLLLLMSLWRAGGRLPRDPKKLSRIAKCTPEEWAEIEPVVLEFFTIRGGWILQKRAAEEIAKYASVVSGSKRGGIASARKKASKDSPEASQNVQQNFNQPEPEPEREDTPPTPLPGGEPDPAPVEPVEAAPKRKPRRQIPADFPSDEVIAEEQAKAREAGANVDVAIQAQRFRNWAVGKDARYADWRATFRNWMLRVVADPKTPRLVLGVRRDAPAPETDEVWRRRVRGFLKDRWWQDEEWGRGPHNPATRVPAHILAEFDLRPLRVVREG